MKKKLKLILPLYFILMACSQNQNATSHFFSKNQEDSLLVNIVTYVFLKAPYATNQTKFEPQFRAFYEKSAKNFELKKVAKLTDGSFCFFLIRPVGGSDKYRRGVLGKFSLEANSTKIKTFEEIINTPHLEPKLVEERGNFLFQELAANGNLQKYLPMKDYIEWPDSTLVYSKTTNEWVSTKNR